MTSDRFEKLVERNRRDDELKRREQQFRKLVEGSIQGLVVFVDDRPVFANQAMANILGQDGPDDILRMRSSSDFVHTSEIDRVAGYRRNRLLGEAAPEIYEFKAVRKDGSMAWLEARSTICEWDGERAIQSACVDITERKYAEMALGESEARFKDFAESASDWYWQTDAQHRVVDYSVNASGAASADRVGSHLLGKTRFDLRLPEDADDDKWQRHRSDLEAHRPFRNFVYLSDVPEGEYRHVRISGTPVFDAEGGFVGYRGTGSDITELLRRDDELLQSAQRYRSLVEGSIQGMFVHRDLQLLFANEECARILGYESLEELQKAGPVDQHFHPDEKDRLRGYAEARLRGDTLPSNYELRALRKDGSSIWLENRVTLVEWEGGPAIQSVFYDITDRKRAEAGLSASEQRFRALVEYAPEAITMLDVDTGLYLDANPMAEALHGLPRDELIGKLGPAGLSPKIQVDGRPSAEAAPDYLSRALAGEFPRFEWMHLDPEGKETLCEVSLARLPDPHRNLVRASITDITERKAAEARRAELEADLAQAQKMEAVGQLTGGVAHDFNNMLAVILGSAELLEDELGENNPRLAAVLHGTKRAADLTQHLLAFSRKQALQPAIININSLIAYITGLLRSTLEEHIDIETVIGAGLWNCEVDRGQLENALVNLAINARDAMPDGGMLTIETANARLDDDYAAAQAEVEPGQYVMLAISDTGSGMPPEIQEHVFEPFYTTKEVGKGTGLGLSMIYGFVKQSGGHVAIYSEPGEGTTIKLYLPRSTETEAEEKPLVLGDAPVARGESVLVVEDDPDLRTLAVALLSNLGYQVMEAATGEAALEQLGSKSAVNLLLTDVMLPGGMNGRELATEIEKRAPGIHVLYMSGYTENAIVHHGRLDAGIELLEKPFRRADLARAVRKALDGSST
jgi:PAS domain S-box-containing protein